MAEFRKREIVAAFCRSFNLQRQETEKVAMSLQSMMNHGVLSGQRQEGAGKTAALKYTTGEACFAAVILELKGYSFSHDVAKGLRPGFFDWRQEAALDLIRQGWPVNLTLRFGHMTKGRLETVKPYVWCALHPEGREPCWSPYLPDTRPYPAILQDSFFALWQISDLLRPFLLCLEDKEA